MHFKHIHQRVPCGVSPNTICTTTKSRHGETKYACKLNAGSTDGTFTIYETLTWEWQTWSHRPCGHLVNAIWSEKASPAAILLFCSQQIVAVHLTDAPPGLHAQLMPLDAPQVFKHSTANLAGAFAASSRGGEASSSSATSSSPSDSVRTL
jgi:hypothetical protein